MSDQGKIKTSPTGSGMGMAPLAHNREQSIANSVKSSVNFQKQFPDIDVKGALIEPTINFHFDMQENVEEIDRKNYEILMAQMFEHIAEPAKAEKFLWEARGCLAEYPDVLKQFDAVYVNRGPVSVMITQLHQVLSVKRAMMAERDLQGQDVAKSDDVE